MDFYFFSQRNSLNPPLTPVEVSNISRQSDAKTFPLVLTLFRLLLSSLYRTYQ